MEGLGQIAAALIGMGLALLAAIVVWRSPGQTSIIEGLERAMVSNQARLDSQESEIDDLRRQINELRENRLADHALLQEWIAYARRLGAMLREATGQEPPPEPQARPRTVTSSDLARLAHAIEGRFSIDEMNGLAFDSGIDGAVTGDTLAARSVSLVNVAKRRGQLVRLVELCRQERPEGGV